MQLAAVPSDVAHAGLRALYSVAIADGELSPLEASFIRAIQDNVLRSDVDLSQLTTITPAELAAIVPAGELRQRILTGAVITSCIDGKATEDEVGVIDAFAKALQLDLAPVRTARKLAKEHLVLARIDIARRSLPGFKARQTLREEGPIALAKQFVPTLGGHDDALTAKYRAARESARGNAGARLLRLHRGQRVHVSRGAWRRPRDDRRARLSARHRRIWHHP